MRMFSRISEQWKKDWTENRTIFWFEMIGTLSSITASVLISVWPGSINLFWVFIFWMIGSLSLVASSYMRSTAWPMLLMLVYTVFNLIGLYNTI